MSARQPHTTGGPLQSTSSRARSSSEERTALTGSIDLQAKKDTSEASQENPPRSVRFKRDDTSAGHHIHEDEDDPIEESDHEEQSQSQFYSQAQELGFDSQQDQFGSQTEMLLSALESSSGETEADKAEIEKEPTVSVEIKKEQDVSTPSTKDSDDGSLASEKDSNDLDHHRPCVVESAAETPEATRSLTDLRLEAMTQTGEIKEVVGSQSVFSQEMRLEAECDAPTVKKEDEDVSFKAGDASLAAIKTEPKSEDDSPLKVKEEPLRCGEDLAIQTETTSDQDEGSKEDEDARIEQLERSGAMTQVVGSQSLLSQEITPSQVEEALGQIEEDEEEMKDEETADATPDVDKSKENLLSPASTARRYNLISTQEQEEVAEVTEPREVEAGQSLYLLTKGGLDSTVEEQPPASSLEAGEEADDDDVDGNGYVGGESLSQQLDLTGLSQDVDTSQDAIRWADEQLASQELPSVTPANSATTSQEGSQTASQMSLGLGFECLLQAADQVATQELRKSSRTPKRSRKMNEMESMEEESKQKKKAKSPPRKKPSPIAASKPVPQESNAATEEKPDRRNKRKSSNGVAPQVAAESKAVEKKKPRTTSHPKPDHSMAQRAADLAARVIDEEHLGKQLLLSMVMERQPTRTPPSTLPPPGSKLPASFVWSHYPPLEKILRDHMEEYYHLSLQKRQSAAQQAFNNALVHIVRDYARDKHGWTIPTLCEKGLRDRIRCYYKTHIQNAKKRLATMLRNPRKVANARHLIHHLDLIKATLENPQPDPRQSKAQKSKGRNADGDSSPASGNSDEEQEDAQTHTLVI
eukprot:CAMPEP_0168722512 /NCGR_PEP_ID=MMETSP0724-20121128/2636_1 /TAXON_ID=265536 /ORGANISM="Amphiprora sp., Strain CCMP467" /LENGTH=810 /DNA_ID=CAMNT_0008769187 /DNA_START=110 /DNA_END=2542 /DNA_ORIENTATION=+